MIKKSIFALTICLVLTTILLAQSRVAITIDDVPNTEKYLKDEFKPILLNILTSLSIPTTIFINEGWIYRTDSIDQNFALLNKWIRNPLIIPGNHTFNHSRYSDVDIDTFRADIEKGESITIELAKYYGKQLQHFRFPYNDLGKDSIQQIEIRKYLESKKYRISPFTIESSDYIFNKLYEYYKNNNQQEEASRIGNQYVETTLRYFDFFDSIAEIQYGRQIAQIYLCHDNALNADYIDKLVSKLKMKEYVFISYDEALMDPIYLQENKYYKKWGVSWIYRWMTDPKERIELIRTEPEPIAILKEFARIQSLEKEKKLNQ